MGELFEQNYVVRSDGQEEDIRFLAVLFAILEQVSITRVEPSSQTELGQGKAGPGSGLAPDSGFSNGVVGGGRRQGRRRDSLPSDPETLGPHPRQLMVSDSSRELGVL